MAACHLIAYAELTLLRDVDSDDFGNARRELVLVLSREHFYVHDDTALSVRNFERRISDLSRLFAEDRSEKSFFGSELGLALRGNSSYEDVAAVYFCADHDDTVVVEILERVVAEVGDVACDLLFAESGVAAFDLVLFYMDRSKYVVFDKVFTDKDSVLVVVTFPGHVSDKYVSSERELAVVGRRTVCKDHALDDFLTYVDDRLLIDAGAVVGSLELLQFVNVYVAVASFDYDPGSVHLFYYAVVLSNDHNAGVVSYLVLHARSDDRSLRTQERNCLTLHVGTHQRTRRIVVFEERYERCRNGYELLGRNVHIVDDTLVHRTDVFSYTAGNAVFNESAVFVERGVCLSNDVLVFFVSLQIIDVIGNDYIDDLAVFVVLLLYLAVRSLDKSVLVDSRIGSERRDKTDVLTFRSFDRAQTSVVRIVDVTHFEACAFSVKTAGTECGKLSLVRKFCDRVVVIHELRQLRTSEELFDNAGNGLDVDEGLCLVIARILRNGHTLFDDSVKSCHTDTELVLEQFAYRSDSAVCKVVDIVGHAETVYESEVVANGRNDIVERNVFDDKVVLIRLDKSFELFVGHILLFFDLEKILELGQINFLEYAERLRIALFNVPAEICRHVYGVVADKFEFAALFGCDKRDVYACVLYLCRLFGGDDFACGSENFAVLGHDVAGDLLILESGSKREFLVYLVSADAHKIVFTRIVESAPDKLGHAVHGRDLARLHLSVKLDLRVVLVFSVAVFRNGRLEHFLFAEQLVELLVAAVSESTHKYACRHLTGTVYAYPQYTV